MPDRFGGAGSGSYDQTFAYLYDQALARDERLAEEADDRREEDQAAKDQQVFDRYNAGKITDEQLLAYIRRRIKETAYDKGQQANWQQALLQYSENINDAKALREFERSNDYAGYISYLRAKLSGMKGNSAKKAELEKQIQSLVDQRDQNSIAKGADRILLNIQRGKASYDDLLAFYKDRLNTVSDPALKQQIRGQITDITARIRETDLQNQVAGLGRQLASRKITPQQYGVRLREIANSSGYKETNPGQYNSWMQDATQAINTIEDYGRLEEIDGMLMRGEITPQKAMTLYYAEAERYKIADPKQYTHIRNLGYQVGHSPAPGQTPLPNPGVLGLPDNAQGGLNAVETAKNLAKQFRFFSQIDGTEFGQVNCVYTSAAMMAWAMGYREQGDGAITGGDLRYLSGDRSIGTNLDEAEAALAKLGITGLRNWNDKHMSFEKFKQRIGEHGQAGVLMGINNNLPDSLKAFAGAAKGHGVFIAAYDPKKDAFLWMDPAISKNQHPDYKGVWVDASVVKNFGWGPGYSDGTGSWSFSGQVLLTPPNTIKGRYSANDVKRPPIKYINVDDVPVRPQTPKNYRGYNNAGPSVRSRKDNAAVDSRGKPRGAKNGRLYTDDDGGVIDTVEEVQAELEKNQKRYEILDQLGDAYAKGKDRVTIGGQEYNLTPELLQKLDRERLDLYDRDILFAQAAGLEQVATSIAKTRGTFLASAATRNSIEADVIVNTAVRDGLRIFENANKDPDPNKAIEAARAINGTVKVLTGVLKAKGDKTDTPLDDLSVNPDDQGSVQRLDVLSNLFDMVANPSDIPLADRVADIIGLIDLLGGEADTVDSRGRVTKEGDALGKLVMKVAEQFEGERLIRTGEGIPYIDGQTGENRIAAPIVKTDIVTGQQYVIPGVKDEDGNPIEMMQVPVETPAGVEMRWVRPGQQQFGSRLVSSVTDANLGLKKGVSIDEATLQKLMGNGGAAYIQSLVSGGILREEPITFTSVQMPNQKKNGRIVPGAIFIQDPGSRNWYQGVIPAADLGTHVGQWFAVGSDNMPEIGWLPYSTAGMTPLPYQGDRNAIQRAVDVGEITVPQTYARGEGGQVDPNLPDANAAFVHRYDPALSGHASPVRPSPQDEDPTDRAERIRESLENVFRGIRDLEYQNRYQMPDGTDVPDITDDEVLGSNTRPPGGFVRPSRVGNNGSVNPPESMGPQPSRGELPQAGPLVSGDNRLDWDAIRASTTDVMGVGASLGLNLGAKVKTSPTRVKDDRYTPPAPKKVGTGKKQESALPRIGGSVMVGGTRIDVPAKKPNTGPPPRNYTPPPPVRTGTGGAAAASVNMLTTTKKSTSKTGNGRYQS